jgi:UDPglucose 6-dehydrogenase
VGDALNYLREEDDVNLRRREHVVDLARKAVGGSLNGKKVAVLGAAFKPNSDDIRDSPALDVAGKLHLAGADVRVFDPEAMANAKAVWPTLHYATSVEDAVADTEVVIVATEWKQFREADPVALAGAVANAHVIDGRNCLDVAAWKAAGWAYQGLGRFATA